MHEKVKNRPTDLPSIMHEKVKNSPTVLPHSLRGVRLRGGVNGYVVEIRPNKWKKTIWLGTYKTAHEAARAYDAGIFYTRKKIDLNFDDSVTSFVAIPPVSLEEAQKSESNMNKFDVFLKEQAAKAARRALDDPGWKRTYDEWCLEVMRFNVCRIFWLSLLHIYYRAISIEHSEVELANHLHVIKGQSYFGVPFHQWLLIHL
jgi:hypothetical protein